MTVTMPGPHDGLASSQQGPSAEVIADKDLQSMLRVMDEMRAKLEQEQTMLNDRLAHIEMILGTIRGIFRSVEERKGPEAPQRHQMSEEGLKAREPIPDSAIVPGGIG